MHEFSARKQMSCEARFGICKSLAQQIMLYKSVRTDSILACIWNSALNKTADNYSWHGEWQSLKALYENADVTNANTDYLFVCRISQFAN